jgi:hypothetical protein
VLVELPRPREAVEAQRQLRLEERRTAGLGGDVARGEVVGADAEAAPEPAQELERRVLSPTSTREMYAPEQPQTAARAA